jgi:hypothetical protein
MVQAGVRPLPSSLALAGALVNGGGDNGPGLELYLPGLPGRGSGATLPSPAQLRAIAALYLQAELEQAGIIPLAESLVELRDNLPYLNPAGAALLEDFYRRQRDWYDRNRRDALFARVFGIGRGALNGYGPGSNRGFQQLFASLCSALVGYAEDMRWGQQPGPHREAILRVAALDLLGNLGPLAYGNTQPAAHDIQDQLQRAIDLLSHPDIGAVFQARGMWDTVRKAYGPKAPDLGRFVTRGQSGMRLLNWLADVLTQITRPRTGPRLAPDAPVFSWAATWLQASGLAMDRVAA